MEAENRTISSPSSMKAIKRALAEMALMRGATPSASLITAYVDRLAKERIEDVIGAIQTIQDLPRREGELAFPEIGTVLAMTENVKVARLNREKSLSEYYQQQVCPKCGAIVGMMRPVGEQFRTWCVGCQSFRKIIPEDLQLTEGEWNLICAELHIAFDQWVKRGSKYKERVDPQFDRELVRGRA